MINEMHLLRNQSRPGHVREILQDLFVRVLITYI